MRLHPRWVVRVGTPCGLKKVCFAPLAVQESTSMKTHTQTTPALTQLCELVEHMTVAMLTTANGQGQLISRPMAPLEMDAEGAIWFFTDLRSSKVEQLSKLNLSFSDMGKATYVSRRNSRRSGSHRRVVDRFCAPMVSRGAHLQRPRPAQSGARRGRVLGCPPQQDGAPLCRGRFGDCQQTHRHGRAQHAQQPGPIDPQDDCRAICRKR
jgi:Pyridoxamine 5'-phosphate oxidase like